MTAQAGGATAIPAPGFADPTRDAQRVFRAVLDALAHPTRSYPVAGLDQAPERLGGAVGAVALTLLDEETTVWLGGSLADDTDVAAWLAFHTGTRVVPDAGSAAFVISTPADLPDLGTLMQGTEEAPHRSATVILDVRDHTGTTRLRAVGPGIDGRSEVDAPWVDDVFLAQLQANSRIFPRGVDLVLVDSRSICALPRTTRVTAIDTEPEA